MKLSIVLLFCFFVSFSQDFEKNEIDSLKNVLKTNKIGFEEQVEILNRLSRIIGKSDFNEGKLLNNKMLNLSKQQKHIRGYGYYYQNLSNEKMYLGDFISAENYAEKAQFIFKKLGDNNNYITSTYNLCFAKDMQGTQKKYDEAEKLAKKTISELENKPNSDKIVDLYYYLATSYNNERKPNLVFFYLNKAIDIYRKINDDSGVFSCNRQLAYICLINNMHEKSIHLLNQIPTHSIIFLNSSIQNKLRTHELYFTNYIKIKKFNKALQHCNTFYKIAKQHKIAEEIKIANIFFAEIYTNLKMYNKAFNCLKNLDSQQNDDWETFQINKTKSQLYLQLKDYKKALYYGYKNLSINPKDVDNLKFIADTEYLLGNYKKSIDYLQKHLDLKVEKLQREKDSQIYEYEAIYKLKENEFALQKSKLETSKKENALQEQKQYTLLFLVISIALFFIFSLLIYNYKNKQKSNRLLASKNEELLESNQLLSNSNKEKEILLREIHHRVKNNLQLVMSLLNIQAQDPQNISIEDFLEKGQSRIATMSLIHQNLYQTEHFTKINFQDYLENLVENIKHTFNRNNVDFEINTNENSFDIDTAIPLGLIINELVCNALKHAFPENFKGKIQIEINKIENNTFLLQIGDNGIGTTKSIKNSKSIGLELVSLLIMQLKGKYKRLDQLGTNYSIEFKDASFGSS